MTQAAKKSDHHTVTESIPSESYSLTSDIITLRWPRFVWLTNDGYSTEFTSNCESQRFLTMHCTIDQVPPHIFHVLFNEEVAGRPASSRDAELTIPLPQRIL